MKLFLRIIFFILAVTMAKGQLEYSNWFFGNFAGLTFNTPNNEPQFRFGNRIAQFEGVASVSSAQGDVLLYTNGVFVYNGSNEMINTPSTPLSGHQSSSQSAILFPKPGSSTLYYLFTADAGEYTGEKNRGINYSVIDITLNEGKGDFIEFNVPLIVTASEQLSATYHANGIDIWVVARGWKNNNFYAYLITEDGIKDTVITSIGFTRTSNNNTIGCLKFSPNGSVAALPAYEAEFVELFRFDNKSGVFYNRIQIDIPDNYSLYGAEFSPNGKVLYITRSKSPFGFYSLYQFDVSEYDKNAIQSSFLQLAHNEGHVGTLQRSINNKIYLAPLNVSYLHIIDSPNTLGNGARFLERNVFLNDSLSQLGLPQVFKSPDNYKSFAACEGSDVILDTDDFLYDTIRYESSYYWTGPNGFQSISPKPVIENIALSDSGTYLLTAVYNIDGQELITRYSIFLRIGKQINISINGTKTICKGRFTVFTCDTLNNNFSYIWSNRSRSPFITVNQEGLYKLYVTSEYGCVDSAEVYLTVLDAPEAVIEGDRLICRNNSVELYSREQDDEYSYWWSTGATTPQITVDEPGEYKLVISNLIGCKDSSTITVVRYNNIKVKILGDTIWCSEGLAKLRAEVTPYDSTLKYKYLWSTGDSTSEISVNKTGTYAVLVTIENQCVYTDEVTVTRSENPKLELNIHGYIELCEGQSISVDVNNKDSLVNYVWSDGNKDFPRKISDSGIYRVIAINKDGCQSESEFEIQINPKPKAEIMILDEENICNADSLILSANPKGDNYRYLWLNNSSTKENLTIFNSGKYFLVVINEFGCSDTISINIELGKGLPVKITGRTTACAGEILTLTASVNYQGNQSNLSYLWSTGETSKSIDIDSDGEYSVFVVHSSGCQGYDTVRTSFYEVPVLMLNYDAPQTICQGDNIEVKPDSIVNNWVYYWDDGSYEIPRIISESGTYKLYALNAGQCIDSAEFELKVVDAPAAKIIIDGRNKLCIGETTSLKVADFDADNIYLWSDGKSGEIIDVTEPGMYYLTVTNKTGCFSTDSVEIISAKIPEIVLSLDIPYLCNNDSLIVRVSGDYNEIIWEDGSTGNEIKVYNPGFIKVTAISDDGCIAEDSIYVPEFNTFIDVKAENLNFDLICPGQTSEMSSFIKNNSDFAIQIHKVIYEGSDEFELTSNPEGQLVSASESLQLPLIFKPLNRGNFIGKFKVYYQHYCPDSLELFISGSSNFTSIISLPEVDAIAGDTICFDIYYKFECTDTINFNGSARIILLFDSEYFLPIDLSIGRILRNEIVNGKRLLEIMFDNLNLSSISGTLGMVCGVAMIGSEIPSEVKISEFEWSDPIGGSYEHGSIKTDACAIDIRTIKSFISTSVNITPNPATDFMKIDVISQERGIFVLELINSTGTSFLIDKWESSDGELFMRDYKVSTFDFPSGVYTLRLLSPWYVNSSQLIIVK